MDLSSATPVPMAFAELYGALESRAVDGQENPYVLIDTSKFYEVQKFASNTNHVYSPLIVLAGKPFWDKLSDSERQILQAAFKEAQAYQRALSRQATTSAMAEVKAKGMKINTGGTSGQPLEFYLDHQAFAREWAHMHHLWQAHGYHTAVQELRDAERRLAELEAKREVA